MSSNEPQRSGDKGPTELAYMDMRALRRSGRPSQWRRACLAAAPYARISVYLYIVFWVATAVLYQGLESRWWIATSVAGAGCAAAALMGIAARQWIRGETVGAWLPIVLLWRITWWLRLDDRDRRSVAAWRRTVWNWRPSALRFQTPVHPDASASEGKAVPFVYRAENDE